MAKLAEQAERYDEMARAGAGDWALPRARRRASRPPGPGSAPRARVITSGAPRARARAGWGPSRGPNSARPR